MFKVAMSTMYALLNEIPRYSDAELAVHVLHEDKNTPEHLSDSQKEQVCMNALSAIVGVAVYLQDEEVRKH